MKTLRVVMYLLYSSGFFKYINLSRARKDMVIRDTTVKVTVKIPS